MSKVTFLGGVGEVGASSALLEIDGARILIDAGVRTSSRGRSDPLPKLELAGGRVDAVLVTHAHADHTAALPLVPRLFGREVPIHMTAGTLHVMEILQMDAVRHMADPDGDQPDLEIGAQDVEEMIGQVRPQPFERPFLPVPGRTDIVARFIPCGHVYGAGALMIDGPGSRVLWMGDFSVSPQPTVGALSIQRMSELVRERPVDLMVTEATYGDSVHAPRKQEEERLVRMLERVVRKEGVALIPAFALGRAQDVLSILHKAKSGGRLADVPVYVDGMVRPIVQVYQQHAHHIYPDLPEPLDLLSPELRIHAVDKGIRDRIQRGAHEGPAIVISSSGMLIGGQSVQYAKALMPGRKNALLVVGYQDEESPGRALLKLKRGGKVWIDGEMVRAKCYVGRYGLSAHVDFAQLRALVQAVGPRRLALVHGDPHSLAAARKGLRTVRRGQRTDIPKLGSTLQVRPTDTPWDPPEIEPSVVEGLAQRAERARGAEDRPRAAPSVREIREVWECLRRVEEASDTSGLRGYGEHEMVLMLLGPGYDPGERDITLTALLDQRVYFRTRSSTGQRSFHPRSPEAVQEELLRRAIQHQAPLDPGDLVLVDEGSGDHVAGLVGQIDGDHVTGVLAQRSRTDFRREWILGRARVGHANLALHHPKMARKWLEEITRSARSVQPAEEWIAEALEGGPLMASDLARLLSRPAGIGDEAFVLSVLFVLARNPERFRLQPGGEFALAR